MSTRDISPLGESFDNTVRRVFGPKPPQRLPSGKLRVANLYPGGGVSEDAILGAGMEVVYSHQPETPDDYLDFNQIPIFDLVIASLAGGSEGWTRAFEFVARFLYIRRPEVFLLVAEGQGDSNAFLEFARKRTERMGYHITANDPSLDSEHTFIVGTTDIDPFVWPTLSSSESTTDEVTRGVAGYLTSGE